MNLTVAEPVKKLYSFVKLKGSLQYSEEPCDSTLNSTDSTHTFIFYLRFVVFEEVICKM
jgi:hypothetical protein